MPKTSTPKATAAPPKPTVVQKTESTKSNGTAVYYYSGPSCSGKTSEANKFDDKWWFSNRNFMPYTGQKTVIIDEFDPLSFNLKFLLSILRRDAEMVTLSLGEHRFEPSLIVICSYSSVEDTATIMRKKETPEEAEEFKSLITKHVKLKEKKYAKRQKAYKK